MDIMELGAIGELIGGVAVIASLVFVGLQVRQGNNQIQESTSLAQRQALDSVVDRVTNWAARVRDNAEINDLFLKGDEQFQTLNRSEKHRYHLTKIEILAAVETIVEHGKSRGIKEGSVNAGQRWLAQQFAGPGARIWWHEMGRPSMSDDLGNTVDTLIADLTSPPDSGRA